MAELDLRQKHGIVTVSAGMAFQISVSLTSCLALDTDVAVFDVSSDGKLLATCSGHSIFVWDRENNFAQLAQLNRRSHVHKKDIRVCRFDPESRFLLTAGDDLRIVVWSLQSKKALRCALFHSAGACLTPLCTPE